MTDFEKDILSLINSGIVKQAERKSLLDLRSKTITPQKLRKVAFDTRRINQETQLNTRRGLQNYNRIALLPLYPRVS